MARFVASTILATTLSLAVSKEGEAVTARLNAATEHLRASDTIGRASIHADLDNLVFEGRSEGWDGYGAFAIDSESARIAHKVLDAAPATTRVSVSVGAEADGQVTIEWHKSASWTLSVSVSPSGELHYAALLGSSSAYGTEPFDVTVGMPETIQRLIRRIEAA